MAIFRRKQSYLGVDFGTSSIKVVELNDTGGRSELVTYGYSETALDIVKSDLPQVQASAVILLKEILKNARVSTDKVVAALPSFVVFSSIISLPHMSEKDLIAAVRWEAKKFVPMPIEEMILDWRLMKETEERLAPQSTEALTATKKTKDQKILLTAAPKNLVKRYVDIFKSADLQLLSLETEAFALERSLIGNDPSPILVMDIGAVVTDISIIVHGIPMLNRSIDVGGETITKGIMNSLHVDHDRAEQFKRDFGLTVNKDTQQIPKSIEFIVNSIVNECKYCLNLFQAQGGTSVEKLILSGGSSFLPNLPEFLATTLNMKAFIGDPWARVATPPELKSTLRDLAPRFAVAIGLAMRNIV